MLAWLHPVCRWWWRRRRRPPTPTLDEMPSRGRLRRREEEWHLGELRCRSPRRSPLRSGERGRGQGEAETKETFCLLYCPRASGVRVCGPVWHWQQGLATCEPLRTDLVYGPIVNTCRTNNFFLSFLLCFFLSLFGTNPKSNYYVKPGLTRNHPYTHKIKHKLKSSTPSSFCKRRA
jgi:hypothetical protein